MEGAEYEQAHIRSKLLTAKLLAALAANPGFLATRAVEMIANEAGSMKAAA